MYRKRRIGCTPFIVAYIIISYVLMFFLVHTQFAYGGNNFDVKPNQGQKGVILLFAPCTLPSLIIINSTRILVYYGEQVVK